MYNGEIKSHRVKKKKKVNVKSLLIWYAGIIISFIPVFLDMYIFSLKNDKITRAYWREMCLEGDILWILATIIVLTVIDYISEGGSRKRLKKVCAAVGAIMWGIVFGIWAVYKYTSAADYQNDLPIVTTLIVAGITMTCCSPLQIKTMEVKG